MTGLAFAVVPVESAYVANGVDVPAWYEYSLPPASGEPSEPKNWSFGAGERFVAITILKVRR